MTSPKAPVRRANFARLLVLGAPAALLLLAGCGLTREARYPTPIPGTDRTDASGRISDESQPGIFGQGGINVLGGGGDSSDSAGIGVNSFLWRASLDTLSFIPLASADPFGGVIITDWYAPPESPNERFKVTVYILDKRLRADGVRVAVFRQERQGAGTWADAGLDPETPAKLENAILTRARQLKLANVDG